MSVKGWDGYIKAVALKAVSEPGFVGRIVSDKPRFRERIFNELANRLKSVGCEFTASRRNERITLSNGSEIRLVRAEPDRFRGLSVDSVGLDGHTLSWKIDELQNVLRERVSEVEVFWLR